MGKDIEFEKLRAKFQNKWELGDWERDIASYERWQKLHKQYNSAIALSRMNEIKAKWPGKEHLFD